jgi:hypothetical protein
MTAPALVLLAATICAAQPQRHDRIFVVPAPADVTVDGDLTDWDLSAAIDSAFDEALAPRFSVRLGFMHSPEALFIGAHFVDDTPLVNRHDPAVEPDRGWAGDCLQVRLSSDPAQPYPLPGSNGDHICHLTMWQFTDAQLPVVHVQYGMDYHGTRVLTGPDSGLAFREDDDGGGYALEARVPWGLLNAGDGPPGAGDRIALVAQPLWGDSAGWRNVLTYNEIIRQAGFSFQGTGMWGQALFLDHGNLQPGERPASPAEQLQPLALTVPLPDTAARSVSLALFDDSELVRTLPVTPLAAPTIDGKLEMRWDGLDDFGKPLPAGDFSLKVLTHRGVGQQYVTSIHSAGNPPWRTDDGTGAWGGDHGPPIAAAADDERVYLGWTVSEAGWAVVAVEKDLTADGEPKKLWGQHQVLEIGIVVTALDTNGELVFAAQDGKGWGAGHTDAPNKAGVVLWDAKTGKPVNFPFGQRSLLVSEWPDAIKPEAVQTHERASQFHPAVPKKRTWQRFAEHDHGPGTLGLNLLDIAVVDDTLYASLFLEDKIVALNWQTGERVAELPVPSPAGLAATSDGQLVAVSGQGLVRIDPVSGDISPLVSGLSHPWGVALDAEGRVYVSDCGDQMRVKAFAPDGLPVRAIGNPGGRPWVGRFDPQGLLMPAGLVVDAAGKLWVCEHDESPRRISVWSRSGKLLADLPGPGAYAVEGAADERDPSLVNVHHALFRVNYKTGDVQTLATLIRPQMNGFQFVPDGGHMGRALKFRHVGGRDYLAHVGRGSVVIYRLGELVAEPVCAIGDGNALLLHGFAKSDVPETVREELWRNSRAFAFLWTDRNGDHLVQPPELLIERVERFWSLYWGAWVDRDLTIWAATGGHHGLVYRVPVSDWTADGVPVYPPPSEHQPIFEALGKTQIHSVMPDGDAVYVMEQLGGDARGGGTDWSAISRYTLDGKRLWAYRDVWLGFGLEAPLARPGNVVGAMKFIGQAALDNGGSLIAVNGYFGQFNLLSSEGLWVASLCKDNRYGPAADETTVWPENFSGWFFRHPKSGKYYLIAGDTDCRIWEITGLDAVRTGSLAVTLSESDHEKALEAAQRRQGLVSDLPPITMGPARDIAIDGDLGDWSADRFVEVATPAEGRLRVGLAYDDRSLLVAFSVPDTSPMVNAGDDEALLFKTGDACEVFLAADPGADPQRTRPAAGDLRLLFSVMGDQPVCVVYRPVVAEGEHAPRVFSSPVSAESFDYVSRVAGATVVVGRGSDAYELEASVPLSAIGFTPEAGALTKGDVGVVYSDAGGTRNVLRIDYANKETAIVNDIPTEARLQPHHWGVVRVQ